MRCVLLLLSVLAPLPALGVELPSLYDEAGLTAWDRQVLEVAVHGLAGPEQACLAAAEEAALGSCIGAAGTVGRPVLAAHAGLLATVAGDWSGASTWFGLALLEDPGQDPAFTAFATISRGTAAFFLGDVAGAYADYAAGLAGANLPDDERRLLLLHLGWFGSQLGRPEAAQHCADALSGPFTEEFRNPAGLTCVSWVAGGAWQAGDFDTAGAWWQVWLDVAPELLPTDDPQITLVLGNRARAWLESGHPGPAVEAFEEVRRRYRAEAHPEDPDALGYAFYEARGRAALGELEAAGTLLEQCLRFQAGAFGDPSAALLEPLNHLADVRQKQGRYDEADATFLRARQVAQTAQPVALPDILNRHAELLHERGYLQEALALLRQMEELELAAHGAGSARVATAWFNQAGVLQDAGQLAEARVLYERTLAAYEAEYGAEHAFVAAALTSLGQVVLGMGEPDRALPMLERSVAIYSSALGERSEFTGTALNNLAQVHVERGDGERAFSLYEQAFAVLGTALGIDHPKVVGVRANAAHLLLLAGETALARRMYEKSVALSERRLGRDHPDTAQHLSGLSDALFASGDYGGAAAAQEEVVATLRAAYGPEHRLVAANRLDLGVSLVAAGQPARGRAEIEAGLTGIERSVRPLLDVTSERERLRLMAAMRGNLDVYLSFVDGPTDATSNYRAALAWKGAVRRSLASQQAALRAGDDPEARRRLQELDAVRRALAGKVLGERPDPDGVEALTAQKEAIEKELARRSSRFAERQRSETAGSAELCAALAPGEALVDYLRYERVALASSGVGPEDRYLAFLLRGGDCVVQRIELGPAGPIDKAVSRYRRRVASGASMEALTQRSDELRAAIWDPVEAVLGDREAVWLVTDGQLSVLPFPALRRADGRYLVQSHRIGLLADARDLLRQGTPGAGALILGGIAYDDRPARVGATSTETATTVATRSAPRGGLESFAFLPATVQEAESVTRALGRGAQRLDGAAASEDAVRALAPGKRILHLATHGFFAAGQLAGLGESGTLNPMLLSGVVLAGANQAGEGGDDGILTAEEVTGLDLRGVELVTLSACETGLGEIQPGEGVLGLRRAFALAGARSLVMSLWRVPDDETAQLMEGFYRALKKNPPVEALRISQLGLLESLRAAGREPHPFFWAAFVASGR